MIFSFAAVFFLYQPPKHLRGVPWKVALRGLDCVGALLVTGGVLSVLVGIVYTTYTPADSAEVIAPIVVGVVLLVLFGIWENVSSVRYKLCPPHIFSHTVLGSFVYGTVHIWCHYYHGIYYC